MGGRPDDPTTVEVEGVAVAAAADDGEPRRMGRRELLQRVHAEIARHELSSEREQLAIRLASTLVNGPTMSRRDLLRASAAGWAAIAVASIDLPGKPVGVAGATSEWLPMPTESAALSAATPTLTASVLRREDMLALRLEFYNLVRNGSNLVRQVAGDPAYVVATFGYGADHAPQNIAEEAFREGDAPGDNDPLAPPGDVDARLAGPTRLAFLVPATATSIPYQLTSILGLLPQSRLNVAAAALRAAQSPAPTLADPGPLETRIEAPWNLVLSPHDDATWSHATTPVTRNGRTELWHTRLSDGDPVGRAVRAIWTEGYDRSSVPDPTIVDDPFLMSLSPNDRWQIVGLSADFGIGGYTPKAIEVDRLTLTALGAWLDANGTWETLPSGGQYDMIQWRHVATMGRDQFVKVVKVGILFPFGHRAVRVAITERKVNPVESGSLTGSPAAYLRRREFIVVRQPVVTYPEHNEHELNDGNQRPFRTVELKTLVTPSLGADLPLVGSEAYFPRSGGAVVPFNVAATDREGRLSEFTIPLVFVTRLGAQNSVQQIVETYNALAGADVDRRRSAFNGVKVGFTPSSKPGDAAAEVRTLTFGGAKAIGAIDPDTELPFHPTWTEADIRLDAVEQVRGKQAGGVTIEPHPSYITGGFDTANPAEVFAKLKDPVPLTFSDGGGDRSGGVITPDMNIVNLSRKLGPQGGDSSVGLPTQFDPSDFFDGAKILGAIELKDILETIAFDKPGFQVPEIKSRPIYTDDDTTRPPRAIETTFAFKPMLKKDPAGLFTPKAGGSLTLDVTYRTPMVPPGEPTWEIVGDLRQFAITMVGTDLRFIRLHFSRLTFTARNGGKPDITPYIDKVELDGPLKFVDSIKDYLKTPGTGPNIDVTPTQIAAGFTLQIPNIPAGAVTIMNIAFSATLIIPFSGDPARARFAMSSREHPFLVTYLALGGGGFFAIELGLDGVKYFELDIVAGVEAAIDLILVTAEVHYLFGVHLGIDASNKVDQISYIRIGGHCGVWGVWSVTLDMYLALDYDSDSNELRGQARFTIEIEYLFLSKSVDLFVERRIAGPAGASGIPEEATAARFGPGSVATASLASFTQPEPSATTAATASLPIGYATLVTQNDWNAYAAAFASNA